jgi:hypothetical protein
MATLSIRKKLLSYLADADDSKIKAIYTLLKKDMEEVNAYVLTDEQLQILDEEHHLHVTGQSKSYTRAEASQIIRGQRSF